MSVRAELCWKLWGLQWTENTPAYRSPEGLCSADLPFEFEWHIQEQACANDVWKKVGVVIVSSFIKIHDTIRHL
jgi:hypothetical protein